MTEIIRKFAPRYNSIIVSVLSFLVVGVFMYVGYAIFNNGKDLSLAQVELLKDYLWWLGLGFVLVMLNWFGAAVPFLKDIIASLVALRTGRQDVHTQVQQPLPTVSTTPAYPQPIGIPPDQMPPTVGKPPYPIQADTPATGA